jgi:hypothetical protein
LRLQDHGAIRAPLLQNTQETRTLRPQAERPISR